MDGWINVSLSPSGVPLAVGRSDRVRSGQKKKRVKEKEEVLLKLEVNRHECRVSLCHCAEAGTSSSNITESSVICRLNVSTDILSVIDACRVAVSGLELN